MASSITPLLPTLAATLAAAAPAAAILGLLDAFQTGHDDTYYFLSGVQGPLFLLLASLGLIACILIHKPLNNLILYLQAWRLLKHARSMPSGQGTGSPTTISGGSHGVHIDSNAIAFFNGHFGSLRKALSSSRRRSSGITAGSLLLSGVFWLFLIVLSVLLLAADIWLHVTLQVDNIAASSGSQPGGPSRSFGRALSASCTQAAPQSGSWQVTFNDNFCTDRLDMVQNDTEGYATLSGDSPLNRAIIISGGYKGQDLAILSDAEALTANTYAASTYGVATQCHPVPNGCNLNVTSRQYSCEGASFDGYVTQQPSFSVPSLQNGVTSFSIAALLSSPSTQFSNSLSGQSTTLSSAKDSLFLVLSCTTQALHVSYTVQSDNPQAQSTTPVDNKLQWLMLAPMFPGQITGYANFGSSQMLLGLASAAAGNSRWGPQDLADAFATAFSEAAASSSAGIMVPAESQGSAVQTPADSSATLLPKAAILMVVSLCFAHALIALLLGIIAILATFRDERIKHIQSQLTYKGALTATLLQDEARSGNSPGSTRNESIAATEKPTG